MIVLVYFMSPLVFVIPTEPMVAHLNGNITFHCQDSLMECSLETPWPDGMIEFRTVAMAIVRCQ
jgi:hypothetical protein